MRFKALTALCCFLLIVAGSTQQQCSLASAPVDTQPLANTQPVTYCDTLCCHAVTPLEARNIVIATGGQASRIPIPGAEHAIISDEVAPTRLQVAAVASGQHWYCHLHVHSARV